MYFNFLLSEDTSLFAELWQYISDRYFSVDLGEFDNFSFGTGTLVSLRLIIIGVTMGIAIASAFSAYDKRNLGGLVRKLIREECYDHASAQTLYDLGYAKNPGVRGSLKRGTVLSRWVRCKEEDEFMAEIERKQAEFEKIHENDKKKPKFKAPEFKRNCDTMHFYIPEEKRIAAEIKFDAKGANVVSVICVFIFAIILCLFLCYILPDMLHLVDNFISIINGSDKYMN